MFLDDGKYSDERHHDSHLSVGVPGTVAGLHLAWADRGKLPWKRLLEPAIALARDGFVVSDGLSRSLRDVLPAHEALPGLARAVLAATGVPYETGDLLKQPDLARTLERIAERGPAGFYEGETAELIEKEMEAHGGLITREDLKAYTVERRAPLAAPTAATRCSRCRRRAAAGSALLEMLNVLEGYDLGAMGFGSARHVHLVRRGDAARLRRPRALPRRPRVDARHADRSGSSRRSTRAALRATISDDARLRLVARPRFEWPAESDETTHLSVVDADRNAVSLTYTLEDGYGSKIVVPGAGFLLNNEMGDFNAGPGLTTRPASSAPTPNLARPGKRMLSSMTPTIVAKDGRPLLVVGSPGGRTIINTVLLTVPNVIDFGMNAQEAVDAPRFHHQWLPDEIRYERYGLSPDTVEALAAARPRAARDRGPGRRRGDRGERARRRCSRAAATAARPTARRSGGSESRPGSRAARARAQAIDGGGLGLRPRSVTSSGCSRRKPSATAQSQHTGRWVASTSTTCSGRKSLQSTMRAVHREKRGLVVVPRHRAERAGAERARLALVPVGEDVPQEAGLGRALDLAEALLAAAALLRPARARVEPQLRPARPGREGRVLRVHLDRDHLPVLRADDDASAAVTQPRAREPPAEQDEHSQADEGGDTDEELDRHGRPPWFGFTPRRSRREWTI